MKFLCVLCDQPMKLLEVAPPDRGSLNVTYECPECSHRIAMLTNPFETQLVSSLGVQIGPNGEEAASKCPFSGMLAGMGTQSDAPKDVVWTEKALARLDRIPEFVRPMARTGIEKFAKERGLSEIDEPLLDQAKDFFGM